MRPTRPLGLAPEARREGQGAGVLALAPPAGNMMETVVHNLEGLLAGVPNYQGIEEVPIASQIHTSGCGTQDAPPFEAGGMSGGMLQRA